MFSLLLFAALISKFPHVLGQTSWPLRGPAHARAAAAPNLDVYLLLDDSPSMAIAGTSQGIATMVNHTPGQGGCAFACHEAHPASDRLENPGGQDNYALARDLGVSLRIDLVALSMAQLINTAAAMATANHTIYQMAVYSFDHTLNRIYPPTGSPSSDLTEAARQVSEIRALEVYDNNCLTEINCNHDTDTDFATSLRTLNHIMPAPGKGTSEIGDTPQEVVLVVSDGLEDKNVPGPSDCAGSVYTFWNPTIYRCQQPFDTSWCAAVKARGIRIAVLYTEYLELPASSWYNGYVARFNEPTPSSGQIATHLQACASPGLFEDVAPGGDMADALNGLFERVVAPAPLTR